ncbi:protein of unknown function [Thiomonas sp. OC7]|nr:protein of unknown function [Thiomonas sp. OC7]
MAVSAVAIARENWLTLAFISNGSTETSTCKHLIHELFLYVFLCVEPEIDTWCRRSGGREVVRSTRTLLSQLEICKPRGSHKR